MFGTNFLHRTCSLLTIILCVLQLVAPTRFKDQLPPANEEMRPTVGVNIMLRKEDSVYDSACWLDVDR